MTLKICICRYLTPFQQFHVSKYIIKNHVNKKYPLNRLNCDAPKVIRGFCFSLDAKRKEKTKFYWERSDQENEEYEDFYEAKIDENELRRQHIKSFSFFNIIDHSHKVNKYLDTIQQEIQMSKNTFLKDTPNLISKIRKFESWDQNRSYQNLRRKIESSRGGGGVGLYYNHQHHHHQRNSYFNFTKTRGGSSSSNNFRRKCV